MAPHSPSERMLIERHEGNPILTPKSVHSWEAQAVFNGCPVRRGDTIHLVYRAFSLPHYHTLAKATLAVSDIGIATSTDGLHFHDRKRFIAPEYPWERFGCEDPRVTEFCGKYYIFYTALSQYPFRADGIRVAVAISADLQSVAEKHIVTPFNAKGMALFPEKIAGKMLAVLTVHTDMPPAHICLVSFREESDLWSEAFWEEWYRHFTDHALPLSRGPDDHVEVGAPPLKTSEGWLLFYSHIRNYRSPQPLFGVEAVLLDLENPLRIRARTAAPLLTPEEYYEKIGLVPNVVFPSGALPVDGSIRLYYGAADMVCCAATINTEALLARLLQRTKKVAVLRPKENPILMPVPHHSWESKATFNPGAVVLDGRVHLLYRAMSLENTSVLGYAMSRDGIHIAERAPEPAYVPREPFEQKLVPGGNSGCEDPRLTVMGDRVYMLYTAFDGRNPPRVALTWILTADFLAQRWRWAKPVLLSPPAIADKDACLFPEKVRGQYFLIHRSGDDIDSSFSSTLDFDGQTWLEEYRWIPTRPGRWDGKKVGIAAPPIKTEGGWVLFYHGVSAEDGVYRVGAVLLDPADPTNLIARLDEPLFAPEAPYEREGHVRNVVFPCGAVLLGERFFLYYGGADTVSGVATIARGDLLRHFERCRS